MKKIPFIWLQENEEYGQAYCGCEIQNGEKGISFWQCEIHEKANPEMGKKAYEKEIREYLKKVAKK